MGCSSRTRSWRASEEDVCGKEEVSLVHVFKPREQTEPQGQPGLEPIITRRRSRDKQKIGGQCSRLKEAEAST